MEKPEEQKATGEDAAMDFDQPIDEADMPQVDNDLLALQKRKSVPTVCITEFVSDDVEVSDEEVDAPGEKTHHRIEDVSIQPSISLHILISYLNTVWKIKL